ncbi:MAG: hypothetical protein ACI4EG_01100 [Fusicatenibacter sp.]
MFKKCRHITRVLLLVIVVALTLSVFASAVSGATHEGHCEISGSLLYANTGRVISDTGYYYISGTVNAGSARYIFSYYTSQTQYYTLTTPYSGVHIAYDSFHSSSWTSGGKLAYGCYVQRDDVSTSTTASASVSTK